MRKLKTPIELVQEGYNAEGAVVFLHDFIEDEKEKRLKELLTCPADRLVECRAVYKYIQGLETLLTAKIQIGIERAAEQVETNTRQED